MGSRRGRDARDLRRGLESSLFFKGGSEGERGERVALAYKMSLEAPGGWQVII